MGPLTRRRWLLQGAGALACASPLLASAADIAPWPARTAAPAWSAYDLQGNAWTLPRLRGQAVLLNFWATWCEPCREEMPALQQLADAHRGTLHVLAVNFKEPEARARRFAAQAGLTLPILLDPAGEAAAAWGVRIFPTTLLIDRAGRPRWRVRGEFDWAGPQAAQLLKTLAA